MNVKQFRLLIESCVRKVVREELNSIVNSSNEEQSLNENYTSLSFNTGGHKVESDVEGVNEEARKILAQRMLGNFGLPTQQQTRAIPGLNTSRQVVDLSNPLAAFINDTAANMTAEDIAGLRNMK